MNPVRAAVILAAAVSALVADATAAAPDIAQTSALAPGRTNEFTVHGENLAESVALWLSFPAEASLVDARENRCVWRVALPAGPPGIGAVRVVGSNGVSGLRLVLIDSRPAAPSAATNRSAASAQFIEWPAALEGGVEELQSRFYRLRARKGQRFAAEVVAQRLGSPLDARLRLLDARGRELAANEDAPDAGADPVLHHRFAAGGEFILELRDTRHQGGPRHRFRLRIDEHALGPLPFLDGALPAMAAGENASPPLVLEHEGNDTPAQAQRLTLPAVVVGRFHGPGDRDWFEFDVEKGQRLVVSGETRRLGSPCDLFFQLQDTNGARLADANVAGADGGTLTNVVQQRGRCRLWVEELNGQGGSNFHYRLDLRPARPGFALEVESDRFNAPAGGSFELQVRPVRRDYDGPIQLALAGLGEGFALEKDTLTGKTNLTKVKVTIPAGLAPGSFRHFAVVGSATVAGAPLTARAATLPALRKAFPDLPHPPHALDGMMALGITASAK